MTVPDALSPARPKTREANPLFEKIMLGPAGPFLKLAVAGGALTLILSGGQLWPAWIATAVTAWVAWRNTKVGR